MKMSNEDRVLWSYVICSLVALIITLILIRSGEASSGSGEIGEICGLDSVICDGEADIPIERVSPLSEANKGIQRGIASFYDYTLDSGWSSIGHFVCAVRVREWRYKMVRVTEISTGRSVDCLVTDFGPDESIHPERVVDLSSTAFSAIKDLKYGLISEVVVEVLE